ncbi:chaps-domain-containing protein [Metschnikowia bicuspidata var. bicuspidata NRRL YB-4993]|uniref:Chaps-domain-containing protein n=1 Tax=Metschnikowia bicuspidata var. bicuspidata NRRL YB-4993 TaxID=869754 RepID=A0A1A0HCN5_9ASCO|nr:chaps-domain-containing protein [Metschnikowia bicuspidata var. bicuspidata NRRL YB-4993]OBA21673.1 chaps-domain-containing protein [Metschnikowia bicuspidata var. bicuspidata NRRL YB-4993]
MIHKSIASVPEAVEEYLGASVVERTGRLQSFYDLGPADMCSIQKVLSQLKTEVGTFLYFTGIDTLNSASIAAHLQALATLITCKSQYWFGEKKHWKVPQLTYCSFNAFSRVDVRVTVHIPGKFETQIVASDGKLVPDNLPLASTDRMWLETFVSSMVRCLLDSDEDDANKVGGLVEIRRENPFANGKASKELLANFLGGFEELFWDGHKLGCGIEVPQPSVTANYLVDGFLKCVQLTQHYDAALEVLRRLEAQEPAVVSLIARVLLMKDEEIQAVQTMHRGIDANNRDAELLLLEADFLMDKKRYDLALHLARQAVQASPSEFKTWATLVKVYTKMNDYENALLTLNSCPMNSNKENFHLKRVVGLKGDDLHLPFPVDVTLDEVSKLQSASIAMEQKNLDPQFYNLPAGNLKLTFAKAYELLTDIAVKTGWEALLKHRAKVFVMEEEYRKERTNGTHSVKSNPDEAQPSTDACPAAAPDMAPDASMITVPDDASTMAVKSPTRDAPKKEETNFDMELKKKRLCERWLDNLFMLLYEDLRAYTTWQAEFVHSQAQQMEYKKSTLEWEILGLIAFRLKHYKEGSIAFSNALRGRFSAKSQRELLKYYQLERSKLISKTNVADLGKSANHNLTKMINQLNEKILEACIKVLVWNHRWYNDFSPNLIQTFTDLVAKEGLIKIQSVVQAVYSHELNQPEGSSSLGIIHMMESLYDFAKEYKLQGVEN